MVNTMVNTMNARKKKVIVDTDMGWDDWLAILFLMQHPDVELIGLTVTGVGEAHLTPGVQNARNLLELGGKGTVPVCAGTSLPLIYSNVFPPDFRQKIDNIFNLDLPVNPHPIDPRSAVTFLQETLSSCPDKVTILSIGGMTNLGTMIRESAHKFDDKIERIFIMGGAIDVKGNVAGFQEYFYDPLAAAVMAGTANLVTKTEMKKLKVVQELNEEDDYSGQLIDDSFANSVEVCMSIDSHVFQDVFKNILNQESNPL